MKVASTYNNKKIESLPKYLDSSLALEVIGSFNKDWFARYEILLGDYVISKSGRINAAFGNYKIDNEVPILEFTFTEVWVILVMYLTKQILLSL